MLFIEIKLTCVPNCYFYSLWATIRARCIHHFDFEINT